MITTDRIYIDGQWIAPQTSDRMAVENPYTCQDIATIPLCGTEEVDHAVHAARRAFPAWSTTDLEERLAHLDAPRRELAVRATEMSALITSEMGAPKVIADRIQVGLPSLFSGTPSPPPGTSPGPRRSATPHPPRTHRRRRRHHPWNYPLHQIVAKIAPALAAGCTVVLKPSEIAPLSALLLAEIIDSVGFPPGVFNLVTGTGPVVGEALAAHPDVDMISFTGSTRAGSRVSEVASATVKKVALELGGKSAGVVLDDADLPTAVKAVVSDCLLNSGQTCTALTRLLVPHDRYEEAVALAVDAARSKPMGDPADPATRIGPLASADAHRRVLGHLEQARKDGAVFATGGPDADVPEQGYFVAPTVLAGLDRDAAAAREELFGPVLTVLGYRDVDDAVELANATDYGLSGAVWSADTDRALAVARRMRTGQVAINGGRFNPSAPFGGYRKSGNGRELGRFGLEEFCEVKAVQLP